MDDVLDATLFAHVQSAGRVDMCPMLLTTADKPALLVLYTWTAI